MLFCCKRNKTEECVVCLECDRNNKYTCDTCKNSFHDDCIKEVIKISVQYDKCPYCRSKLPEVLNELVEERRTGGVNGITWWEYLGINMEHIDDIV